MPNSPREVVQNKVYRAAYHRERDSDCHDSIVDACMALYDALRSGANEKAGKDAACHSANKPSAASVPQTECGVSRDRGCDATESFPATPAPSGEEVEEFCQNLESRFWWKGQEPPVYCPMIFRDIANEIRGRFTNRPAKVEGKVMYRETLPGEVFCPTCKTSYCECWLKDVEKAAHAKGFAAGVERAGDVLYEQQEMCECGKDEPCDFCNEADRLEGIVRSLVHAASDKVKPTGGEEAGA